MHHALLGLVGALGAIAAGSRFHDLRENPDGPPLEPATNPAHHKHPITTPVDKRAIIRK